MVFPPYTPAQAWAIEYFVRLSQGWSEAFVSGRAGRDEIAPPPSDAEAPRQWSVEVASAVSVGELGRAAFTFHYGWTGLWNFSLVPHWPAYGMASPPAEAVTATDEGDGVPAVRVETVALPAETRPRLLGRTRQAVRHALALLGR